MNRGIGFESGQLSTKLQAIATAVRALAQGSQEDSLALLALLRCLEELHREIRDGLFQASLPDNRQALYNLLKDIETEGGWPYIERMKLQSFLANLPAELEVPSAQPQIVEGFGVSLGEEAQPKANASPTTNVELESDSSSQ